MIRSAIRGQVGNYRLLYDLGRGQQGTVFCTEHVKTGQHFALKIVNLQHAPTKEAIEREISIHQKMSHPNIIKYVESFVDGNVLYVVMELGQCSLANFIDSRQDKSLTEPELIAVLKDLANGISHIHKNGVIHRDIKIDNVIVKHRTCKITDFGVSSAGELCQTFVGTPVYLAPEIMSNRVYSDAYDKSVDIWALGVLGFEAYFRVNPFFYHGSKLMSFSDFDVIMDNIINICTPKFEIQNVLERLRKQQMNNEAKFITKKLTKTSKHLMYLFQKFFEFEAGKRAKLETILQLLNVMEQPDLIAKAHEDMNKSIYYSEKDLSETNSFDSNSIKSDSGLYGRTPQPALKNGFYVHPPKPLAKTMSMNDSRLGLRDNEPVLDPNGSFSSVSSMDLTEAQLPQFIRSMSLNDKPENKSLIYPSMSQTPSQFINGLNQRVPPQHPSTIRSNISMQGQQVMRRPSIPQELNFINSTKRMICEMYVDKIERVGPLIGALEALMFFRQEELGNYINTGDFMNPQEIDKLKSMDLATRRMTLKSTIFSYFQGLYNYLGKAQAVNECLFRLIVCSAFGEIVSNLASFMTHFKAIFGGNMTVMALQKFAPTCSTEQVAAISNYIVKCFS